MSLVQGQSRRCFLRTSALVAAAFSTGELARSRAAVPPLKGAQDAAPPSRGKQPWFRRTYRWGQTNLTEEDPASCDVGWWRDYWKRTGVQGVIINAGGIVAYYPSKYSLQYRAKTLGTRDLYGELAKAAQDLGLAVLARMDSNRAHEDFYKAHPDWFARDANGKPYRTGDLYVTCINSGYYQEWIPDILKEIIQRSQPEGITDNSWAGLGRGSICYCDNCRRGFRERARKPLPQDKNWSDPTYRAWIEWNYARRLDVWDLNNAVTKAAGGPDCLWIGMNSGSISGQAQSFRLTREICARAEMILLDHQARSDAGGFQQNAETGKLIHGLLGWDKLVPESMAMYQAGRPTFRKASKPEPEARLWALEAFAGGIQPWWHHVGATQEDQRQFRTIEPLNRWHQANEQFLVHRQPIATVGVAWSQQNTDYFGRDHAEELVDLPARGITEALLQARIPSLPIHLDDLERAGAGLALLVLPNLAAMSEAQVASVRQFVERGGGLLATGESSRLNEWGEARPDFALSELFGAHLPAGRPPLTEAVRAQRASETSHTYLRLAPDLKERHSVLRGFEETQILAYGGSLEDLTVISKAEVPLTFVPSFPVYPPETSWMRQPRTSIPGLVLNTTSTGSRVAFLPADLDRRFARDYLPDHGNLLANLIRWAAKDQIPLVAEGPGLIDCELYRQEDRLILHLVNLTNAGTWRQPVHELIAVGPFTVRIRVPAPLQPKRLRYLVAGHKGDVQVREGWVAFEVKSVLDHEVVVIS